MKNARRGHWTTSTAWARTLRLSLEPLTLQQVVVHAICRPRHIWSGLVYRRWNLNGALTFGAAQATVLLAAVVVATWAGAWSAIGRFFTTLSAAGLTGLLAGLAVALLAGGLATICRITV